MIGVKWKEARDWLYELSKEERDKLEAFSGEKIFNVGAEFVHLENAAKALRKLADELDGNLYYDNV